jgi:hypothetical protein
LNLGKAPITGFVNLFGINRDNFQDGAVSQAQIFQVMLKVPSFSGAPPASWRPARPAARDR